jgi:hypothetical protein
MKHDRQTTKNLNAIFFWLELFFQRWHWAVPFFLGLFFDHEDRGSTLTSTRLYGVRRLQYSHCQIRHGLHLIMRSVLLTCLRGHHIEINNSIIARLYYGNSPTARCTVSDTMTLWRVCMSGGGPLSFRSNLLPPSSESKSKPSKKPISIK